MNAMVRATIGERSRSARVGALVAMVAVGLAIPSSIAEAAPVTIAPAGGGAGYVDKPIGAAVDQGSGDLYVADSNNFRIDKFDSVGDFLLAWGFGVADSETEELQTCGPEASPPTLKCYGPGFNNPANYEAGNVKPESVAVDQASHDIYVADPSKRRITRFRRDGEFIYMIGKNVDQGGGSPAHPGNICKAEYLKQAVPDTCGAGESGTGAGEYFGAPTSLVVDQLGNLWVGDDGRVLEFDSEGQFVSESAVPGGGGAVKGLTIDPLGTGDLWMKSQSLAGVRRYALAGSPPLQTLTEVGSPLDLGGEPEALTLDSAGNVYIGDKSSPYRFKVYDPAGELFSQFGAGQVIGRPGAGGGGSPGGTPLALDEASGALYAASSASGPESAVQRFPVPEPGPLPEEPEAEGALPTSVTLTAALNPEGRQSKYRFEYLTEQTYHEQGDSFEGPATEETEKGTLPGSEYETEGVSAAIEHLIPETAYRFRLAASNECESGISCETHSEAATFTTPPAVQVDAQWTDEVAAASALFKAELDPLGAPADWRLEYGATESYGNTTAFQSLGSGIGAVPVAAQVAGLAPDTVYHYRFTAKDVRDGVPYTVHGPDRTVLTALGVLGFELPDDRAWEQVTPLRKGGGRIVPPWLGLAPASEDGSALSFISVGPVSEAAGDRFPEPAQSLARRGPSGWSSEDIEPPRETAQVVSVGTEYKLFTSSLSSAALEPRGLRVTQPGPLSPEASEWTPYLRENFADPVRWRPLVTGRAPFANVCPGVEFGGEAEAQLGEFHPPIRIVGGSPDLRMVILRSKPALSCDAEGVASALYEWSGGTLSLISDLPDGKAAGLATLGSAGDARGSIRGAVSSDGRFVYWSSPENNIDALYVRDTVKRQTVRLDEAQPHSIGGADDPFFQGASTDGRRAFFTDTRHLTPDAGESGADLYECEIVEAGGKDECLLRDLTPETEARESAEVQGMVSAISETGEDLYFVANGALAPGAVSGDCLPPGGSAQRCNLYHAHLEGGSWSLRLVAVLSGGDRPDWAASPSPTENFSSSRKLAAAGSPSGRYLTFMSELPLTGYDSRDAKSGQPDEEVFRYDSVTGSLACVSCAPSGARPRGAVGANGYQLPADWQGIWTGRWLGATLPDPDTAEQGRPAFYRPRVMLDDGRVLFNAFDGLVPADSNSVSDAYEYEPWGSGTCTPGSKGPAIAQAQGGACVALLSSGSSQRESAVIDSSASGDDVFIITASRLSVLDEDPDYDIYDVRVGGTAARREATTECLGEACQSPPPAPDRQTSPTAARVGDGNLTAAPRERCAAPARAAHRLARSARRARRHARHMVGHPAKRRPARHLRRRARRLAHRAQRLSKHAKRCRRRTRGSRRIRSSHR